jgi:hypothetical protein
VSVHRDRLDEHRILQLPCYPSFARCWFDPEASKLGACRAFARHAATGWVPSASIGTPSGSGEARTRRIDEVDPLVA